MAEQLGGSRGRNDGLAGTVRGATMGRTQGIQGSSAMGGQCCGFLGLPRQVHVACPPGLASALQHTHTCGNNQTPVLLLSQCRKSCASCCCSRRISLFSARHPPPPLPRTDARSQGNHTIALWTTHLSPCYPHPPFCHRLPLPLVPDSQAPGAELLAPVFWTAVAGAPAQVAWLQCWAAGDTAPTGPAPPAHHGSAPTAWPLPGCGPRLEVEEGVTEHCLPG